MNPHAHLVLESNESHRPCPFARRGSLVRRAMATGAIVLCAIAPGCVTDKPTPHSVRSAPAGTAPTALQMWVRTPVPDTDGNGFPDTLPVTVYLFAEGYPLSIETPGTFRFELYSAEGKLARVWTIDAAKAKQSVRRAGPGPAYVFALSLLDSGSDRVRRQTVDLSATFTPESVSNPDGGTPVKARTTTIQIGG